MKKMNETEHKMMESFNNKEWTFNRQLTVVNGRDNWVRFKIGNSHNINFGNTLNFSVTSELIDRVIMANILQGIEWNRDKQEYDKISEVLCISDLGDNHHDQDGNELIVPVIESKKPKK